MIQPIMWTNMVYAVSGSTRAYLLGKVGTSKKLLVEITKKQSEAYHSYISTIQAELQNKIAEGQVDFKIAKAWCSQRRLELLQ